GRRRAGRARRSARLREELAALQAPRLRPPGRAGRLGGPAVAGARLDLPDRGDRAAGTRPLGDREAGPGRDRPDQERAAQTPRGRARRQPVRGVFLPRDGEDRRIRPRCRPVERVHGRRRPPGLLHRGPREIPVARRAGRAVGGEAISAGRRPRDPERRPAGEDRARGEASRGEREVTVRPPARMTSSAAALLVLAAGALAQAQAPDRSKPPAPGPPPPLKLPAIQRLEPGNSIPVLFIETHKVPLVQVAVVLRSGVPADPKGKPGLANLTAEMLDRGAAGRSALELSDAIDHLGADLGASADWDEMTVGLSLPSERLEPALAILSDVVRKPTFPAGELERVRKELLTTFLQWRDEPESIARVAFARAVYGDHPYGRVPEGTEAYVRAASREDLERFHRTASVPGKPTIVAAGDVSAASLKTLLDGAFGSWTGTGEPAPAVPPAPQVKGRSIWIVDVPEAAQSEIRIGRVGAARSTPD